MNWPEWDGEAYNLGREWRLLNPSAFITENPYSSSDQRLLWMSWNAGCNDTGWKDVKGDIQGELF